MARETAELAVWSGRALLCSTGYEEGVHLGEGYGLPRTEVVPSDAKAPTDGPRDALMVAALRGAYELGAPLFATGANLDSTGLEELRARYERDPGQGASRFRELGLRWQTAKLRAVANLRARGDVLKDNVTAFLLESTEGEPTAGGLQWLSFDALRVDWRKGEVLLSPSLARVVRVAGGDHDGDLNQPLAWSVAPHLEMLPVQTPTLPPATHTNVFLVGSETAVLIEPASPYKEELDRIEEWVRGAESGGRKVKAILATHHHVDHISGANALADRLGVPLWAHAMTAQRLEGMVAFDRLIEDGERIELSGPEGTALTAVHTPGHAPGHLCFIDEASNIMIAGDMVAGVGTILVEPHDGDMGLYLESLRLMAAREPKALLPAHGGVIANPQQLLEFYVQHRLMREQKVLDALSEAGDEARPEDLLPRAYGDTPKVAWPLAARSTEAHLIKLEKDGKAERVGEGWKAV